MASMVEVMYVAKFMKAKIVVEDEFVFHQGDIPDFLYLIISGSVNVYLSSYPFDILTKGIGGLMKKANFKGKGKGRR